MDDRREDYAPRSERGPDRGDDPPTTGGSDGNDSRRATGAPGRAGRTGELAAALEAHLRAEVASGATVNGLERMTGGASRETWAFDATWGGEVHPLVLRRDRPGGVLGASRGTERSVIAAAAAAGVPVPAVLSGSDDPAVLGAPFFVMARVAGEALPRRILRDDAYARARNVLVVQCGDALARIHAVDPDRVDGLGRYREPADLVAEMRSGLDALGEPHPVLELALNWLDDHLPAPAAPCLVHGDFRMGNLLVDADGLAAVLDWELAHAGDPAEDLGWMCVRSWRFGHDDAAAGGVGTRDELLTAYTAAGGRAVDADDLRFWEVYGNVRWGLITIVQASVHLGGAVRSVELAAIGRRTCEVESDLLDLLGAPPSAPAGAVGAAGTAVESGQDRPTLAEALDAVAGWLDDDAAPVLTGRVGYHRRVASRLLRILEREALLGPGFAGADRRTYRDLLAGPGDPSSAGAASEPLAGLTRAVARGLRERRIPVEAALPALREVVDRKLAIANPSWPRT